VVSVCARPERASRVWPGAAQRAMRWPPRCTASPEPSTDPQCPASQHQPL
jgi:hypothetical protein